MVLGMLPFAIRRELIPVCGRGIATPRSFIPTVSPKACRPSLIDAGCEHLNRPIIGKDRLPCQHTPSNGIRQWYQQRSGLADPIHQRWTVNADPIALGDATLPIQWKVICAFVDQHMG